MKYLVKFVVVTFFVLVSTHSFAEDKIVVLDLTYVLNQSKAGKGAQDFLKKTYETNIKKFSDMEKDLKKEETDLLAKKKYFKQRRIWQSNEFSKKKKY